MSFASDIKKFTIEAKAVSQEVFVDVVDECHRSIQEGSEITGAPGQPVDEGILKASWQKSFESPDSALISTNAAHARANEDGVTEDGRPYVQRSKVGGRHSVKLTVAGFQKIVDHCAAKRASNA